MGPLQTLEDVILFLRRRWLLILCFTVLGSVVAAIYALGRPHSYSATALLQIEAPRVEEERGTSSSNAARQLQLIEQRMMVRDNLLAVIERNQLFQGLPASAAPFKTDILRSAVRLQSVAGADSGNTTGAPTVSALIITVTLEDPEKAAAVANDFAGTVLDQAAEAQAQRTRESVAFFKSEEARLAAEITAVEADVTAYKNRNLDALPSGMDMRRDEMANLRNNLDDIDIKRTALQGERTTLEATQPVREVARRRIEEINTQLAVLDVQRSSLEQQRSALDATIARAPEIETALSAFDRRLQQVQDRYAVVSRRLAEAETDERLAAEQQVERFAMLEPAIVPQYPDSSSRKKIAAMGGIGSLLLGLGLAFLLELLRPVLRSSGQMERALGIRPVVAIPDIGKRPRAVAPRGLSTGS